MKNIELIVGKDVKDIPDGIKQLRLMQGLTQDDMEVRTGISQNLYSMHESYKRRLSDNKIQKIVDGLDAELVFRLPIEEESETMENKINNEIIEEKIYVDDLVKLIDNIEPKLNKNVINNPKELFSAMISGKDLSNISTKLNVSIPREVERINFIKNLDLDSQETIVYDENNNVLNGISYNGFEAVRLYSKFKNDDEFKRILMNTEQMLNRELDIEKEQDDLESKMRKCYTLDRISFKWVPYFDETITLKLDVNTKEEVERFDYPVTFISDEFEVIILPCILKLLNERGIEYDSEELNMFIEKLTKSKAIVKKYVDNNRELKSIKESRGTTCLESFSPSIFSMSTELIDIDFWYYDAAEECGYDKEHGAVIGYDITFIDESYSYKIEATDTIETVYKDGNYKNFSLEKLAIIGLNKMKEFINK